MMRTLLALAAIGCGLLLSQARAAPPTVTPSPGYDARLQEERAARVRTAMPLQGQPPAPHHGHHARGHHDPR